MGHKGMHGRSQKVAVQLLPLMLLFLGVALYGGSVYSATYSTTQAALQEEDLLLQFTTSGGHVVGFQRGSVVVGALDHMLRIELVGARAAAADADRGEPTGVEPMRKVG